MPITDYSMISFDVDETIFRQPSLRQTAHTLGFGDKWNQYDEMYKKGRISLRDRLISHYKLLKGVALANVMREVSKVEVIKNIRETVLKLQGHQIKVILLTDLPDFVCSYLIETFGFEGYVASKVGVKDGNITDDIEPLPDKRLGLRKYSAWTGIPLSRCIHVGDGMNDIPVFRIVGYSVALNSKLAKVKALAAYEMTSDDMLGVYRHLQALR
jgi:HAD superfamily phosphoserine phosphatase-like hydrolase